MIREGTVVGYARGAKLVVRLDDGTEINAMVSARLRIYYILVRPSDRVALEQRTEGDEGSWSITHRLSIGDRR